MKKIYGDNMLFQQKENVKLCGTGVAGEEVKAELFDDKGEIINSGTTVVDENGKFTVSFLAPEGGFREYKIVVSVNGQEYRTLNNVVFGEQWLSFGQSNMEYYLKDCPSIDAVVKGGYGSKWVRAFMVPMTPLIDGKKQEDPPEYKQEDINGGKWIKADDPEIEYVSAIAYFFANDLVEKLQMPVGILNCALGGSVISSWISREKLENDKKAMEIMKSHEQYVSLDEWDTVEDRTYLYRRMCSCYNAKLYPLKNLAVRGGIWYQGESDIVYTYGQYSHMFDLLQKEMKQTFSYEDGDFPIIYSTLASHYYLSKEFEIINVQDMNVEFANMQHSKPESRALVPIYDIMPEFNADNHPIHPNNKEPIGHRFFDAAMGLVYNADCSYTASCVDSVKIEGENVFVKFDNVCDGLVCKGENLKDFAVCSSDGIYYKAEAEIVSKDTVRIHSKEVPNPVSASYAMTATNYNANLYASENGEPKMPVAAFVTDRSVTKRLFSYDDWAVCDREELWRLYYEKAQYTKIWETKNCKFSVRKESAYSGEGGMNIVSDKNEFSIWQDFRMCDYPSNAEKWQVIENNDWSNYKSVSFKVRNNSEKNVCVSKVKIRTKKTDFYMPTLNGTNDISCVIPADGEWHTVEMDVNDLCFYGHKFANNNSSVLKKIIDFEICFSSTNDRADIDVDEFEFSSTLKSGGTRKPSKFINGYVKIKDLYLKTKALFEKKEKKQMDIKEVFKEENKYEVLTDVKYGEDVQQKFDLVIPKDAGKELNLFVVIHGGAWIGGDKKDDTMLLVPYVKNRQMIGGNINYRLLKEGRSDLNCETMLEDIHEAMKKIVEVCNEKGYTLKKLILKGNSAGGHLVLMYAYKYQHISPVEVAVVYSNCGPTDMTDKNYYGDLSVFSDEQMLTLQGLLISEKLDHDNYRSEEVLEKLWKVSPCCYAKKDSPATIFHSCGKDMLVPVSNGDKLNEVLKSLGVDSYYDIFDNSQHCCRDKKDNQKVKTFDKMEDEMIKKYTT